MKSSVFLDKTMYAVEPYPKFRSNMSLHLQFLKLNYARNQHPRGQQKNIYFGTLSLKLEDNAMTYLK
jgi:hypothetical protein